jgi:hypothetical protein
MRVVSATMRSTLLTALSAATVPLSRIRPLSMAAPDINWSEGKVVANELVAARGTRLLQIESSTPLSYMPGHILGFGFDHPDHPEMLKGPYTVTRCDGHTLDIVYRTIPDGSNARLESATAIQMVG